MKICDEEFWLSSVPYRNKTGTTHFFLFDSTESQKVLIRLDSWLTMTRTRIQRIRSVINGKPWVLLCLVPTAGLNTEGSHKQWWFMTFERQSWSCSWEYHIETKREMQVAFGLHPFLSAFFSKTKFLVVVLSSSRHGSNQQDIPLSKQFKKIPAIWLWNVWFAFSGEDNHINNIMISEWVNCYIFINEWGVSRMQWVYSSIHGKPRRVASSGRESIFYRRSTKPNIHGTHEE